MQYGFVCQPISNGIETVAYEILARELIDDDRAAIASSSVLQWARAEVGRLRSIDRDALELAIASAPAGIPHHINISVETVGDYGYFAELGRMLLDGIDPSLIVLEISEAIDPTPESTQRWIGQIKAMGFSVALDDYGHHHGNKRSRYLFRPDILKFDGDLIGRIFDSYVHDLIEAELSLCKKWDLFCVAEHVANEAIYRELVKLCDRIGFDKLLYQGWHFKAGELCRKGQGHANRH